MSMAHLRRGQRQFQGGGQSQFQGGGQSQFQVGGGIAPLYVLIEIMKLLLGSETIPTYMSLNKIVVYVQKECVAAPEA